MHACLNYDYVHMPQFFPAEYMHLYERIYNPLVFSLFEFRVGVNSLTPGRYGSNFKSIIFKPIIQDSSLGTPCEIALRLIS